MIMVRTKDMAKSGFKVSQVDNVWILDNDSMHVPITRIKPSARGALLKVYSNNEKYLDDLLDRLKIYHIWL